MSRKETLTRTGEADGGANGFGSSARLWLENLAKVPRQVFKKCVLVSKSVDSQHSGLS